MIFWIDNGTVYLINLQNLMVKTMIKCKFLNGINDNVIILDIN